MRIGRVLDFVESVLAVVVVVVERIFLFPFMVGDWLCVKLYGQHHMDMVEGRVPKDWVDDDL